MYWLPYFQYNFYCFPSSYLNGILHKTSFYTPFILLLQGRTVFMYNLSFWLGLRSHLSHWYCFHLPTSISVTSHLTSVTFFLSLLLDAFFFFHLCSVFLWVLATSILFMVSKCSNCYPIFTYLGFDIIHEVSDASFLLLPSRFLTFCSEKKKKRCIFFFLLFSSFQLKLQFSSFLSFFFFFFNVDCTCSSGSVLNNHSPLVFGSFTYCLSWMIYRRWD